MLFTLFCIAGLSVTFLGAIFRGPGTPGSCRGSASNSRCRARERPLGNWKLTPRDQPPALTREALRVAAPRPARRPVAAAAPAPLDRRGGGPVAGRGGRRHASASCGPTCPAASAPRSHWAISRPSPRHPAVQGATLKDGAPSYFQAARTYVSCSTRRRGFQAGRQPRRRRRGDQRADALPALPAPGLQAQLLHHQLLVRVPLPRLALRPAGHQGAGSLARPPAASTASPRTVDSTGVLTVDTARSRSGRCPSRSASPASSRPSRPPAAYERRANRPRAEPRAASWRPLARRPAQSRPVERFAARGAAHTSG